MSGGWAVLRHHDDHRPEALTKAAEAVEVARADDLLEQVRALRTKSLQLKLAAEQAGEFRTALVGVREARACLELLADLERALRPGVARRALDVAGSADAVSRGPNG